MTLGARMWARREVRRRRWSLVVLGLICGVTAAVALSSFAGARRADTAWDRLTEATNGPDAVIFASQVNVSHPDWAPVASLPYVESAGSFGLPFITFTGRPDSVAPGVELGLFTVASGDWRTVVDRPVIEEGRAPDPADPHELLAPPEAKAYGVRVGDHFTVRLPSDEQVAAFDLFGDPQGEEVDLEVVGIGRSTFESAIVAADDGGEVGSTGFFATPAFHERYSAPITFIDNLLVKFRPGEGSVARLEADARAIFDKPTLPVLDVAAVAKRVTNGTSLEANGLALFGLAVSLAGAVLVGQALSRSVRAGAGDVPTLRALGFRRADARTALALPHLVPIGVAVLVALVGAVLLSPFFPIGTSRKVDPDVGLHADWVVLGFGVALMVALLLAVIAFASQRATVPVRHLRAARRSFVVDRLTAAGASPSMTVGASLALEPGRDARALPTRPALAGVIVGVVGIIAAQTFLVGMDDAIATPARFGATWDLETSTPDVVVSDEYAANLEAIAADPDVRDAASSYRALLKIDDVTQPTYAIDDAKGALDYTVYRGRAPAAEGEVALGPETADAYGVDIGDTVTVDRLQGGRSTLTVVGIGLLPTTPHSSYDQGAWVSPDGLYDIAGARPLELAPGSVAEESIPPIDAKTLVRLRDGADRDAVVERLTPLLQSEELVPASEPIDLGNLRNVRALPVLFAVFTLVLAVGTVGHVCSSVVRRRGTDLAVLRALGLTPRQTRAAFGWQATTLSVIGLVVGIPVGLVLGRTLWRVVADLTPLVFSAPVALVGLLVALPVTVLLANAIAAVPGRRAARMHPGDLLTRE